VRAGPGESLHGEREDERSVSTRTFRSCRSCSSVLLRPDSRLTATWFPASRAAGASSTVPGTLDLCLTCVRTHV
jgi:hypothetical protein